MEFPIKILRIDYGIPFGTFTITYNEEDFIFNLKRYVNLPGGFEIIISHVDEKDAYPWNKK
jgi:hypothetical protein